MVSVAHVYALVGQPILALHLPVLSDLADWRFEVVRIWVCLLRFSPRLKGITSCHHAGLAGGGVSADFS